jgi:hypothetical protein
MQGPRNNMNMCARAVARGHIRCVVVNKLIYFQASSSKVQSLNDLHVSLFTLTYTNNLIYVGDDRHGLPLTAKLPLHKLDL